MKKKFLYRISVIVLAIVLTFPFMVACKEEETPPPTEVTYEQSKSYTAPSEVDFTGYNTFYFDGVNGKDSNSGKSPYAPMKTLSAMSELAQKVTPDYPVRILLKRGSVFPGKLILTGYTASAEKPLVISDYGEGDDLPKLTGLNEDTDTVYSVVKLTESNTRICNLEITDPYAYQGINVYAIRVGKMENIVVQGCYVHDVNFFWSDEYDQNNPPKTNAELDAICPEYNSIGSYGRYYYRTNGGIIFQNDTKQNVGASWYENVYAIDNIVDRVARTGIYMSTKWSNAPGVGYGYNKFVEENDKYNNAEKGIGYFMHKNVNFVNNRLNLIGGDGIIIAGMDSFLEGNVCYRANYLGRKGLPNAQGVATTYFNAAIWCYNSNNVYFQYNEAGYTFLRNGAGDGEGFDIDNACKNIYFQYNYAHNNEGGGLLVCNNTVSLLRYDKDGNCISPDGKAEALLGDWRNNYCRNNVFVNNGSDTDMQRSAFVTIARLTDDFYCYNNTVILGKHAKQHIINQEDNSACKHYYANNLICSAKTIDSKFDLIYSKSTFENNLYYNVGTPYVDNSEGEKVLDKSAISDVVPYIDTLSDYNGIATIKLLKAKSDKVYTMGKLIDKSLDKDFDGLSTNGKKYIGAFAGV